MTDATAARIVAEFGPDPGRDIVDLAQAFIPAPAPPSGGRPVLRVASKDIAKLKLHPRLAQKAISETVLASVCPDDPELQATGRDVVAGLIGIAPKTPVEAMLATQMIGMHNAVADSLRMARESSEPLRGVHLEHANRLSRTFAALVEAFERIRNKGRQTVVVQHVYPGGQAVGAVTRER
jgi:hypothetical protein